jgi:DNA polymerase I-like protein with 3'-5' exonuclease and polymerase domains
MTGRFRAPLPSIATPAPAAEGPVAAYAAIRAATNLSVGPNGLLEFTCPVTPTSRVVIFDIETASAAEMRTGRHEGPFNRLYGWMDDADGVPHTSADPGPFLDALNDADVLIAHNGFFYDLIALALHNGVDYGALAAKLVDTLPLERLIDPPLSKGMPNGYYSLDTVAKRLGHGGKTDEIKALAAKHGGFDKIPVDDPEYVAYLEGDLLATRAVWHARREYFMSTPYAWREMEVEALKGFMSFNGWRVDRTLLTRRVAEEDAKRAAAVEELHARFGMPTHKPDRFKVRPLKEWAEPRVRGRMRSTWRHNENGSVTVRRTAVPSTAAVRRYTALFPEAAVERGYADRIPGERMKSPWATRAGKDALIQAFARAGAVTPAGSPAYPKTPTGDIALGKNELGEGEWYCGARRRSFPGMLMAFGDIPAVRDLVELILTASGARLKYAEVMSFMTPEDRVYSSIGQAQGSGRWAHIGPSTTNMGARGDALEERGVMISDPGCILVTGDLATADVRGLAILSQDPVLISMLQPGEDYHSGNAEIFFGDRAKRKPAKAIGLGAGYGQGARAIALRNGLEQDLVQAALDERERKMPDLAVWTGEMRALGASGALLENGFGRMLRPDPERAHTQSLALPGQSASRDIMTESMLRFVRLADAEGIDVRPMLRVVVHDELVTDVPVELADTVSRCMEQAMTWEYRGVPIICDLGVRSTRWSECVED